MKPEYWLAIGAVAGAVIGFALNSMVDWLDATTGMITGVLIGAIIYNEAARRARLKEKNQHEDQEDRPDKP